MSKEKPCHVIAMDTAHVPLTVHASVPLRRSWASGVDWIAKRARRTMGDSIATQLARSTVVSGVQGRAYALRSHTRYGLIVLASVQMIRDTIPGPCATYANPDMTPAKTVALRQ